MPNNEPHRIKTPLQLSVDIKGKVFINDQEVAMNELIPKLKAITEARGGMDDRIYMRADKKADYGTVAKVMGQLSGAGFKRLALVTDVEYEGNASDPNSGSNSNGYLGQVSSQPKISDRVGQPPAQSDTAQPNSPGSGPVAAVAHTGWIIQVGVCGSTSLHPLEWEGERRSSNHPSLDIA